MIIKYYSKMLDRNHTSDLEPTAADQHLTVVNPNQDYPPRIAIILLVCFVLLGCQTTNQQPDATPILINPTASPPPTTIPPTPISFPPSINPLTGLPVLNPNLLEIPAVLVSISHFPATGRPQAGLSFAPFVYEVYITEGATRFLTVYYGQFPQPEIPLTGQCRIRTGAFTPDGSVLGGQAWLDKNGNGLQEPGDEGVGGVCVNVYDSTGAKFLETTTDGNGYYGFNQQPGKYLIEFVKPEWASITHSNLGNPTVLVTQNEEFNDSDVDPATGQVEIELNDDIVSLDVGLVDSAGLLQNQDPAAMPAANIGPIRSGRLVYGYLADSYPHSCLIFAGASPEVMAQLPECLLVFHQLEGGGYMLDIDELQEVARANKRSKGSDFSYSSNVYSNSIPSAGAPAARLDVFIAYLNQSAWIYDPLYQAYLRYVDTSEVETAGILSPDKDRLTGRPLHSENVIILFAQHDVVSPTNLDIRLNPGRSGKALLFRDGQVFNIQWNTGQADSDEIQPVAFMDQGGMPVALKPGHTWVLIVTKESSVSELTTGNWKLFFVPPEGAS